MTESNEPTTESADAGLESILARIPKRWGKRIDCGPGWHQILVALDQQLAAVDPNYVVYQVKEKFAGLRYYCHSEHDQFSDRMDALVRSAEAQAAVTCEECRQSGTAHKNRTGWVRTLCPLCATGGSFEPLR